MEQCAAEVVRLDEHEHRRAPDQEQRPEVLQAPLRQHLALVAQVPGEEDDEEDLGELAGLELQRADLHPEAGAVDRLADPWQRRQCEQDDGAEPEEVLVALDHAVVPPQREQRQREEDDADDDPEALPERVVGLEPVDRRHADRREQRRHRQQVWVRVRHGVPRDEVRGEVERQEERGVRQRLARDDGLPGDVDAGEADRREETDRDQVEELAVARAQR